ncbi:MAG: hypothetical protein Q7S53_05700 [bacterium]|nr:hypothetical protein [bacterium]
MDYIIPIVALALLMLLLLLLIKYFLRKRRQAEMQRYLEELEAAESSGSSQSLSSGESTGQGEGDSEAADESKEAEEREALRQMLLTQAARKKKELAEKMVGVKQIIAKNNALSQVLCQKAGMSHMSLQQMNDEETVRQIAKRMKKADIEVFKLAASQQDIQFNLKSETTREPVPYPTNDMEPTPMSDFDQMPQIMETQKYELGEQYYSELAQQRVLVMQSYESKTQRKLLYILMDVSGSMADDMNNGFPRHVWARGIALNLMLEALEGKAKYFYRPFDGETHRLMQVENRDEARNAIAAVESTGFSGGGTDIPNAIARACKDIRTKGGDIGKADILLITDGRSDMNPAEMKNTLGDIKLHTIVLGLSSEELKEISSTYKQIS